MSKLFVVVDHVSMTESDLEQRRKAAGITIKAIAKESGISENTVSRAMKRQGNPYKGAAVIAAFERLERGRGRQVQREPVLSDARNLRAVSAHLPEQMIVTNVEDVRDLSTDHVFVGLVFAADEEATDAEIREALQEAWRRLRKT